MKIYYFHDAKITSNNEEQIMWKFRKTALIIYMNSQALEHL